MESRALGGQLSHPDRGIHNFGRLLASSVPAQPLECGVRSAI